MSLDNPNKPTNIPRPSSSISIYPSTSKNNKISSNIPQRSWSDIVRGIPTFDGTNPILTNDWLKLVEIRISVNDEWGDTRVEAAICRLDGKAKEAMESSLITDWKTFKEELIYLFNPESEKVKLLNQLTNKIRYKNMSHSNAIKLAKLDKKAFGNNNEFNIIILLALADIFPGTILDSYQFQSFGNFDNQISNLERAIRAAESRNDNYSKWINTGINQVYSVQQNNKEFKYNNNNNNNKGKERYKKNQYLKDQINLLKEQIEDLTKKLDSINTNNKQDF